MHITVVFELPLLIYNSTQTFYVHVGKQVGVSDYVGLNFDLSDSGCYISESK